MKTSPTAYIGVNRFDCEFIPPLDLPEEYRIAWERQLDAAQAWQAAGGNADTMADRGIDAGRGSGGVAAGLTRVDDGEQPTIGTITSMNTLLVSLMERLLEVQTEVANVAVAEMSLRHTPSSPETATDNPRLPLHAGNARLIEQLATLSFELLAAAQSDLSAATGLIRVSTRRNSNHVSADQPWLLADRRRRAQVINFPDRRQAA